MLIAAAALTGTAASTASASKVITGGQTLGYSAALGEDNRLSISKSDGRPRRRQPVRRHRQRHAAGQRRDAGRRQLRHRHRPGRPRRTRRRLQLRRPRGPRGRHRARPLAAGRSGSRGAHAALLGQRGEAVHRHAEAQASPTRQGPHRRPRPVQGDRRRHRHRTGQAVPRGPARARAPWAAHHGGRPATGAKQRRRTSRQALTLFPRLAPTQTPPARRLAPAGVGARWRMKPRDQPRRTSMADVVDQPTNQPIPADPMSSRHLDLRRAAESPATGRWAA